MTDRCLSAALTCFHVISMPLQRDAIRGNNAVPPMTVLRYVPPTLQDLIASKGSPRPSCDVKVTNDTRTRRYAMWSDADAHGYFVGEVLFNRSHHRRKRVAGVFLAMLMVDECAREIQDLLIDGWTTS